MKQKTKRLASFALSACFFVGAVVVYVNFITVANKYAQTVKAELLSQETLFEAQKAAVEQVEKLIEEYEGEGDLQDVISMALPLKPEIASALTQVNGIVSNNGLTLHSIRFSVSGNQNVARVDEEEGASDAASIELIKPLGTVRVEVSFEGGYDEVKRLMKNFEENIRIFDAVSLSLVPPGKDKDGKEKKTRGYSYNLILETYYQGR